MEGLRVSDSRPKSPDFEVSGDFRLADYMNVPEWRYDRHEPMTVTMEVEAPLAWLAERHFGVKRAGEDEQWAQLEIETTHADAVVEWVLGLGSRARIVGPESVRQSVVEALQSVVARYEVSHG
jgi:predicted DNA-binding transcriptional regulator YafY